MKPKEFIIWDTVKGKYVPIHGKNIPLNNESTNKTPLNKRMNRRSKILKGKLRERPYDFLS